MQADTTWIAAVLQDEWGGPIMWADGRAFDCRLLPALIAGHEEGLAIYEATGTKAELVLLHALEPYRGIGTALVAALVERLAQTSVRELWLTTTNDNLDALRLYQRRAFRLAEVRAGAMDGYRERKPWIPLVGNFGIAIRDDLRLVRELADP